MNNKKQDTEQCADFNSRRAVCMEEIKKNPNLYKYSGIMSRVKGMLDISKHQWVVDNQT